MATNFHQPGDALDVTAPANVQSSDFVVIGDLFGVAAHDAVSGNALVLYVGGVWRDLVSAGEGVKVYHDGTSLTTNDGGGSNTPAGVGLGDGLVRLNDSF